MHTSGNAIPSRVITREIKAVEEQLQVGHRLELDGLRGLAASMVVFYHGSAITSAHWMDSVYARLIAFCHSGVDLFFVLSGYLITEILYRDLNKGNPIYYFYVRRALRIIPLLFLLVLVLAIGPIVFSNWPISPISRIELLASMFFFSNFKMAASGFYFLNFLGCTWSVALEEQFYLLWPSLVRNFSRAKLLKLCGIILPLSLFIRIFLVSLQTSPVYIRVMLFTRLDSLAFGAIVYLFNDKLSRDARALKYAYPLILTGLSLMLSLEFLERATYPYLCSSLGFSLMGITFASLLFLLLNSPEASLIRRIFRFSLLTTAGKFCYGIYLLHGAVIYFFKYFLYYAIPWIKLNQLTPAWFIDLFQLSAYLAGTMLISAVVYYCFEFPFLKLQKQFR